MGRPSKKQLAVEAAAASGSDADAKCDAPRKKATKRVPKTPEDTRADVARSYFSRVRWPKIVRSIRSFAADPHGLDGGCILAALTPLLLEPVRPVEKLPTRRTVPPELIEAGKNIEFAYRQQQQAARQPQSQSQSD